MGTTIDKQNATTSAQEVEEFKTTSPSPYFAYGITKPSGYDPIRRLHVGDTIATWVGDKLGAVIWSGDPYHCTFGDIRQNFRAKMISGDVYSGTAYLSSGDYVRIRKVAS